MATVIMCKCEWCKKEGLEEKMVIEGIELGLPESEWEYFHEDCHDKLREYAREKFGF